VFDGHIEPVLDWFAGFRRAIETIEGVSVGKVLLCYYKPASSTRCWDVSERYRIL